MLEDACKEMGLSDEAAEQITTAYGKQAEEKINKVNSMVEFVAKREILSGAWRTCLQSGKLSGKEYDRKRQRGSK